MLPGNPALEDYDSTLYDPFWRAAIELEMPLSFHILTTRESTPVRGPAMNGFLSIVLRELGDTEGAQKAAQTERELRAKGPNQP